MQAQTHTCTHTCTTCVICTTGTPDTVLNGCQHVLCAECLDTWLTGCGRQMLFHQTCPFCRGPYRGHITLPGRTLRMLGVCERMVQNVQTVRLSRNPSNSHSGQSVRNAFPSAAVAAIEAELAASAFARAAAARSHDEIRPARPPRPVNLGILRIPGQRFWISPVSRHLLVQSEDSFQFSTGSAESYHSDESF